jgi:glycosyltransferase involved in cell wall biosynthesis
VDGPHLAIVIPAYREAATIGRVVGAAIEHGLVIVVDDCSPDETGRLAREAGAVVVRNDENGGYDRTLCRGFEEAAARGCTHVVTMDADGEHDPSTLGEFKRILLDERVPLVLGVRPRKQRIAEVVMGWYVRARFGARDILCGMKGYDLALWRQNHGFDHSNGIGTELAINSLRRGCRFREIKVSGERRRDAPRFDRRWRANARIMAALMRTICHRDVRLA